MTFPPNVAVRIIARKARSLGSVMSGAPLVLSVMAGRCPFGRIAVSGLSLSVGRSAFGDEEHRHLEHFRSGFARCGPLTVLNGLPFTLAAAVENGKPFM